MKDRSLRQQELGSTDISWYIVHPHILNYKLLHEYSMKEIFSSWIPDFIEIRFGWPSAVLSTRYCAAVRTLPGLLVLTWSAWCKRFSAGCIIEYLLSRISWSFSDERRTNVSIFGRRFFFPCVWENPAQKYELSFDKSIARCRDRRRLRRQTGGCYRCGSVLVQSLVRVCVCDNTSTWAAAVAAGIMSASGAIPLILAKKEQIVEGKYI